MGHGPSGTLSAGPAEASQHGRGWRPLCCVVGNNVECQIDPSIAGRLRRAWEMDPHAPLVVTGKIEGVLRDYLENVLSGVPG
jgi:hypothetical protein